MKIAAHASNYKNDHLVVHYINNVGKYVDQIYIAYPKGSFGYDEKKYENPVYKNTVNPLKIEESNFAEKVIIVEGNWVNEQDQRNEIVTLARKDGYDYLIVQDIDEFLTENEADKCLRGIYDNPSYLLYKTPWMIFWKSTSYVLQFREVVLCHNSQCRFYQRNSIFNFSTAFAINLKKNLFFDHARVVKVPQSSIYLLDGICCHLAWVHSDEGVQNKISTWVHTNDVRQNWYDIKWLGWRPESRWLSYSNPCAWNCAVPYKGKLPEEIKDYDPGFQAEIKPNLSLHMKEIIYDTKALCHDIKVRAVKKYRGAR